MGLYQFDLVRSISMLAIIPYIDLPELSALEEVCPICLPD